MKSKCQAFWQFIGSRLKVSQPVMLLLVAESIGSSPGRQGFKMAVASNGELSGSIGGGIMEVKLVELAKTRLKEANPETLVKKQFHHKSAPQFQSGMICSGEQTILFVPLHQQDLRAVQTLIRCLKNHRQGLLSIARQGGKYAFQALEHQQNNAPYRFEHTSGTDYLFEENIGYKNRLYIIGAGHCSLALSKIMANLDFYLCLLDDRPGLDTFEQNKFVHEKHLLERYEQVSDFIPSGNNIYVVVMTVGYRSDDIVMRQLVNKNLTYLGLLGSETKVATLLEKLRDDATLAVNLDKIKAPIGMKISSRTPEEIAVSIAGEIIAVKNA